jgi:hypothetical protein
MVQDPMDMVDVKLYYLSVRLNNYIKRNLFDQANDKVLAQVFSKILKNIPAKEFKNTFHKLIERMELRINNNGDHFKN